MPIINAPQMSRLAGVLYLAIIVFGIASEVGIRAILIDYSDARLSADNILGSLGLFRLSMAGDALMAICDIMLAIVLFLLLRPVGAIMALAAMVFRLVQAVIIAASLMYPHMAVMVLTGAWPVPSAEQLALFYLNAHAHAYDLGLLFFAVNSLITGWLITRSTFLPGMIGWLLMLAGLIYLTGSTLRFMVPELYGPFQAAYVICLVAELGFALWLLAKGVDAAKWNATARGQAES